MMLKRGSSMLKWNIIDDGIICSSIPFGASILVCRSGSCLDFHSKVLTIYVNPNQFSLIKSFIFCVVMMTFNFAEIFLSTYLVWPSQNVSFKLIAGGVACFPIVVCDLQFWRGATISSYICCKFSTKYSFNHTLNLCFNGALAKSSNLTGELVNHSWLIILAQKMEQK